MDIILVPHNQHAQISIPPAPLPALPPHHKYPSASLQNYSGIHPLSNTYPSHPSWLFLLQSTHPIHPSGLIVLAPQNSSSSFPPFQTDHHCPSSARVGIDAEPSTGLLALMLPHCPSSDLFSGFSLLIPHLTLSPPTHIFFFQFHPPSRSFGGTLKGPPRYGYCLTP